MSESSNKISLYESVGGHDKIIILVDRFYFHMDTLPEAQTIRKMHQGDLSLIKEKLVFFLSGWMGGPHLYFEKYGHPKLRARHLPFKISLSERDQWVTCMFKAMEDCGITSEPVATIIRSGLFSLADHMINT
jgi:hemoglobin